MRIITTILLVFLPACAPISREQAAELARAIAKDNASVCLSLGGAGGGGSMIPGPGMIPAIPGGYGSGYLYLGRSNEPGTTVTVNASGCVIERGKGDASK